jgi:hypothetical protein
MRLQTRRGWATLAFVAWVAWTASGCKSDLNQQLLERELRYQEDQIYYLQDELQEKRARLESVASENVSLRRQLGVNAADDPAPSRGGRPQAPRVAPATTIPPAIELPGSAPAPSAAPRSAPRGGPPVDFTPPTLEGVPSLPAEPVVPPRSTPRSSGLSLPPAAAAIDPRARPIESAGEKRSPALVRVGFEESMAGDPIRLVIKPLDDMASGRGITIAIEPRDSTERLVSGLTGDVTVTAYDGALAPAAPPIARWTIPSAEALARFRPTGRHRGITLDLPWQGPSPTGDHVRVRVETATATGVLDAESLVPVR